MIVISGLLLGEDMRLFVFGVVFVLGLSSLAQPFVVSNLDDLKDPVFSEKLLSYVASADLVLIGSQHDRKYEDKVLELSLFLKNNVSDIQCKFWEESTIFAEAMEEAQVDWSKYEKRFYLERMKMTKIFQKYMGRMYAAMQINPLRLKPYVDAGLLSVPIDHSYTDEDWLRRATKFLRMDKGSPDFWNTYSQLFLNERNAFYKKKILVSMSGDKPKCKKAIFSVGKDHLLDNPNKGKTQVEVLGLPTLLEPTAISTAVVELKLSYSEFTPQRPNDESLQTSQELAESLKPHHPLVSSLFEEFTSTSLFHTLPRYVEINGREESFFKDDYALQRGLQILIDRGDLKPNSLILSDTGHDIPMAAQLGKNSQFKMQAVFVLPEELNEKDGANRKRIIEQAQDWGEDIKAINKKYSQSELNTLFIGLEGHRQNYSNEYSHRLKNEAFPSTDELKDLGIERVYYIYERHPDHTEDIKDKILEDSKELLRQIGLPFFYIGTDCRRNEKC